MPTQKSQNLSAGAIGSPNVMIRRKMDKSARFQDTKKSGMGPMKKMPMTNQMRFIGLAAEGSLFVCATGTSDLVIAFSPVDCA